jgi:hypothetical protein
VVAVVPHGVVLLPAVVGQLADVVVVFFSSRPRKSGMLEKMVKDFFSPPYVF